MIDRESVLGNSRISKRLACALIVAAGAVGGQAAAAGNEGFYGLAAGGVGYWENGDASRDVLLSNLGGGSGTTDKTSGAYKLGVGYQFNEYNGVDLAYHYNGKFAHKIDSSPFGPLTRERKVRRIGLSYVLSIPATQNLSVMGRLGVQRWEEKATTNSLFGTETSKRNDTDAMYGIGAKYRLGERASMTLEYEYFHHQEDALYLDFSEVTAGLQIRF